LKDVVQNIYIEARDGPLKLSSVSTKLRKVHM
jgi:hypothetical protein